MKKILVENFYTKFLSLLAALIIWMVVNDSITDTRVFHRVPVRVINLPPDKTVRGVMPDGFLDRRVTVTLTGMKNVLDQMEENDLELVVDALNKKADWIVKASKRNLVCLNPDVDLVKGISSVVHSELIIRMCRVITGKVPVHIVSPVGSPPHGYLFLDVWPRKLYHIMSGPEDDIRQLQIDGMELEFDLSSISREELDLLRDEDLSKNEVSFYVPDLWKKVHIPYLNNFAQPLHCPEFSEVRLDFLFEEILPIGTKVPIRFFCPDGETNASPFQIVAGGAVDRTGDMTSIDEPLYASNVSRLFLDIVRNYLQIIIVPARDGDSHFCWEPHFIGMKYLEDAYVARALAVEDTDALSDKLSRASRPQQEEYHRARFREYIRHFTLCRKQGIPLSLQIDMTKDGVSVAYCNP